MSFDCLLGYFFGDSLARSNEAFYKSDSLLGLVSSWNLLKHVYKYLYAMTEYDAVRFHEWYGYANYLNPQYVYRPGHLLASIEERANVLLGPRDKRSLLIRSDAILKIRIRATWTDYDSTESWPTFPSPIECVQAEILDTIKGKRLLAGLCSANYAVGPGEYPCVRFSYSRYHSRGTTRTAEGLQPAGATVDPTTGKTFVECENCFDSAYYKVGEEYYIFLRLAVLDFDGTSAYYNYYPYFGFDRQGGSYRIENGMVRDENSYWGLGKLVAEQAFENELGQQINLLKNP